MGAGLFLTAVWHQMIKAGASAVAIGTASIQKPLAC